MPSVAYAQFGDAGIFSGNRRSYSPTPFELIDQTNGEVTLVFTPLTLPAGAGIPLSFGYTLTGNSAGNWTIGLQGLATEVSDMGLEWTGGSCDVTRTFPTAEAYLQGPIVRGQGFLKRAFYLVTPEAGNCATQRWFETADHLLYNIETHDLYYPTGLRCRFDAAMACYLPEEGHIAGRLVLTLTRDVCGDTYTQYVQGSQTRTVVTNGCVSPMTMTYTADLSVRVWSFDFSPGYFASVTDPESQTWTFTTDIVGGYGPITSVTTPGGGEVHYDYEWGEYGLWLTGRHQRDLPGGPLRDWTITRTFGACGPPWCYVKDGGLYWQPESTQIVTPGGATYGGGFCVPPSGFLLSGDVAVGGIQTCGAYATERVDVSETWTREVFKTYPSVATLVGMRSTAVTVQTDSTIDGSHSFHTTTTDAVDTCGYATQVTETSSERPGDARVTTRTFLHPPSACTWTVGALPDPSTFVYRLGLLTQDTVSEHGQTFVRQEADYNATTGFTNWTRQAGIQLDYAAVTPAAGDLVHTVTTATGVVTTFGYDWGEVSSIATPGSTLTRAINGDGTVASETQASRTTTFTYDGLGRLRLTQPPGSVAALVTDYPSARVVTTARGTASVQTTTDGFGIPLETLDSTGARTVRSYDAGGRLAFASVPSFAATPTEGTTVQYDPRGRVIGELRSDASSRAYQYHHDVRSVRDENNRLTWYAHQMLGTPADDRVLSVYDAAGQTWNYSYNALGSLTEVSGPPINGQAVTRSWTYSATTNALVEEVHPESGTVTYPTDPLDPGYYPDGQVRLKIDAAGTEFRYTYDTSGRLETVTATPAGGSPTVTTLTYVSGTDLLASTTDGSVTTAWGYEAATGRLASRTDTVDGHTFETTFAYDTHDNLTEIVYPSGRHVYYGYDAHDRLDAVCRVACAGATGADVYASGFTYAASGALESYTAGNGVVTTLTYDPHRQWLSTLTVGPAPTGLALTYTYDAVGNVRDIIDTTRLEWRQQFDYDTLDRLTGASAPAYGPLAYTYDAHGNRQSGNGATYTYHTGAPFHLQSINGSFNLAYDNNGNLRSGFGGQYDYTPDNQLQTSLVNGITTQYAYDTSQWRVKKAVAGQAVVYTLRGAGSALLTEWSNSDPATAHDYIYAGGRLIAEVIKHVEQR